MAASGVPIESLDKDQLKTVSCHFVVCSAFFSICGTLFWLEHNLQASYDMLVSYRPSSMFSSRFVVLRLLAIIQQIVGAMFRWLRQWLLFENHQHFGGKAMDASKAFTMLTVVNVFLLSGSLCAQLHGKVPENESENISTLPGVSNARQWKCPGIGSEGWRSMNGLKSRMFSLFSFRALF